MVISFIGHGQLSGEAELYQKLREVLDRFLPREESVLFFCGGYGDFDRLCASVCREVKSHYSQGEMVFISPYGTESFLKKAKELIDLGLYDSMIYPPIENCPPRYAILKRNEWIVDHSDLIISYVTHDFGGAYKALEYAKKKKKNILDLTCL